MVVNLRKIVRPAIAIVLLRAAAAAFWPAVGGWLTFDGEESGFVLEGIVHQNCRV